MKDLSFSLASPFKVVANSGRSSQNKHHRLAEYLTADNVKNISSLYHKGVLDAKVPFDANVWSISLIYLVSRV